MMVVALLFAAGLLLAALSPVVGRFDRADRIAILFCGSQKSLVSGVPIANVLFPAAMVGPMLIPIMIYYPLQLVICAWLAKRYAEPAQIELPAHHGGWLRLARLPGARVGRTTP
jgi:sodium/bile acid cotransporter 7